jgi:hypothetical protein
MSGIFDQIINYSPPLIVSGTVNYKGTWNASTNNPTLNDPPAASTKGDYYVVSTAGTQFSITFGVGDWIISNGTAWEKVDLTDAVHSVFGRTGAVVGDSTDYSAVGLTNTAIGASSPSTGAFTSLSSSSTTTLNGTTVPASKTLVVTTDKLSALAATTSAELAGVISDETGSGALVFATSPTLVTPILGTPQSGTVTNLTGTASININGTVGATTPTTGVFTGLTVNDNTTLGSSNSDTVNFNARVASDLNPSTDNTYDLGVTGHEWRNLNIDGTANIDSLVADTADINGGTIDGTAIGATTPSTGAFTTVSTTKDNGGITLNNSAIGNAEIYFQAGGTNKVRIGLVGASTPSGLRIYSDMGGAEYATFSSTGLAVTGALSSTGNGSFAGAYGSVSVTSNTGTNGADVRFINTGGTYYVGVDSSTGGAFGATAYDMIHFLPTGRGLSTVISGSGVVTRVSSTGLAVTGALSSTGQITSSRARSDTLGDVGFAFGAVSQWGWRDDTSNRANLDYYNGATWSNMLQVTGGTGLAVTGTLTTSSTTLHTSSVSLTNGAAAALGTLTNAPTAGNPTKWIPIVDNGTTRYIPCW